MKLTIEIDLDSIADDPAAEGGRILRYWAGALGQMDLSAEAEYPLMNAAYDAQVGTLRIASD
ncbi:hypothetical protein [Microbacterium indicum]|uniref:hypothetical protein n=1 Tax=Microbacterium indicum TaxID=358100 RepID=UPI0003FE2EEC|nr:hypothetical protein [Microbacterium indicum]